MAENPNAQPAVAQTIGERLREMRKLRGYTLRHVADLLGISPSAVSQIETGVLAPSVSRLHEMVSVLGFSVAAVFDGGETDAGNRSSIEPVPHDDVYLQRAGTAPQLTIAGGITWTQLAPDTEAGVEILRIVYPAGAGEPEFRRHAGRDTVLVQEGAIEVSVGFQTVTLSPGDTYSFPSHAPHRVANHSEFPAVALWFVVRAPAAG